MDNLEIIERLEYIKNIWGICFTSENDEACMEALEKAIDIVSGSEG